MKNNNKIKNFVFSDLVEGFLAGLLNACEKNKPKKVSQPTAVSSDPALDKVIKLINNDELFDKQNELSKLFDTPPEYATNDIDKVLADNATLNVLAKELFGIKLPDDEEEDNTDEQDDDDTDEGIDEQDDDSEELVEEDETEEQTDMYDSNINLLEHKFQKLPLDGVVNYYQTTLPVTTIEKISNTTNLDIQPGSLVFIDGNFYWYNGYYNYDKQLGMFYELSLDYFSFTTSDGIPINTSDNLSYAVQAFTTLPIQLDSHLVFNFANPTVGSVYELPHTIIPLTKLENALLFNIEIYDDCNSNLLNRTVQLKNTYAVVPVKINEVSYSSITDSCGRTVRTYKYVDVKLGGQERVNLLDLENIIRYKPKLVMPSSRTKNMYIIKPNYSKFFTK